ncbi:YihY family inner membrane protein [Azospirillum halopraeferens]|uniref:YihY family inner membrane protein n=1 Tax=Azospirillum halopraeferens TaxID=34010 RepID=UPI00040A99EB|nr:YihY family inner membrane protein [Azospirillum halopraeferens]
MPALKGVVGAWRRARSAVSEVSAFTAHSAMRFYNDNCFQTAASLTYTTLLAIVPLMTIGFAIFTAFPAFGALQTRVQEVIFRNMVPEIGDAILEYLGHFMANAGQMTVFGVIGLAFSAILLMWTIEGSFAAIWRIYEPRSMVTRILSFWAILTLAPLFFGASLSLSSTLWTTLQVAHLEDFAYPLVGFGAILPYVLQMAGCTFLYLAIPNRPVSWLDAACGGAVGSLLLELSKAGFGWYLRTYPAYQTIYGAMSTIPIFLFWLYIAWSTVLFGAVVTAALPEWRAGRITRHGPEGLLPAQRLALALAVLHELMDASRLGVGLRRRTLVQRVPVGAVLIDGILEQLRDAHWAAHTTRESWVVTRDLGESTLYDLMKALGIGLRGSVRGLGGLELPWQERTAQLLEAAEANQQEILGVPLKVLLADTTRGGEGTGPVPLRPHRRSSP